MILNFPRVLHATKRKAQSAPKTPEPMTPKLAKVEEDPIYDDDDDTAANDADQQDPFDEEYMDGGGEDDGGQVAESDVRDEGDVRDNRHEVSRIVLS